MGVTVRKDGRQATDHSSRLLFNVCTRETKYFRTKQGLSLTLTKLNINTHIVPAKRNVLREHLLC